MNWQSIRRAIIAVVALAALAFQAAAAMGRTWRRIQIHRHPSAVPENPDN